MWRKASLKALQYCPVCADAYLYTCIRVWHHLSDVQCIDALQMPREDDLDMSVLAYQPVLWFGTACNVVPTPSLSLSVSTGVLCAPLSSLYQVLDQRQHQCWLSCRSSFRLKQHWRRRRTSWQTYHSRYRRLKRQLPSTCSMSMMWTCLAF